MSYSPITAITPLVNLISLNQPVKDPYDKFGSRVNLEKLDDIYPFFACFCAVTSCYWIFPKCVGCSSDSVFICLEHDCNCCKVNYSKETLCKCCGCDHDIVVPYVCCKSQGQCCCLDQRIAIPCDQDVPCLLTMFGLTFVENFQFKPACCQPISILTAGTTDISTRINPTGRTWFQYLRGDKAPERPVSNLN